jgi:hypothetical protein
MKSNFGDTLIGVLVVFSPVLFLWFTREDAYQRQISDLQRQIQEQQIYIDGFEKGVLSK